MYQQVQALFVMRVKSAECTAEAFLDLIDQEGQEHPSTENTGEILLALTVGVLQMVALVLGYNNRFILDLPSRMYNMRYRLG